MHVRPDNGNEGLRNPALPAPGRVAPWVAHKEAPGRTPAWEGMTVVILGLVLLIIGLVASIPILMTIGAILLVVGLILNLVPVGGTRRRVY